MKKIYLEPLMEVVEIKTRQQLLVGSPIVNDLGGDDIIGGGGGNGTGGSTPQAPEILPEDLFGFPI